jgi:hypothetical protein
MEWITSWMCWFGLRNSELPVEQECRTFQDDWEIQDLVEILGMRGDCNSSKHLSVVRPELWKIRLQKAFRMGRITFEQLEYLNQKRLRAENVLQTIQNLKRELDEFLDDASVILFQAQARQFFSVNEAILQLEANCEEASMDSKKEVAVLFRVVSLILEFVFAVPAIKTGEQILIRSLKLQVINGKVENLSDVRSTLMSIIHDEKISEGDSYLDIKNLWTRIEEISETLVLYTNFTSSDLILTDSFFLDEPLEAVRQDFDDFQFKLKSCESILDISKPEIVSSFFKCRSRIKKFEINCQELLDRYRNAHWRFRLSTDRELFHFIFTCEDLRDKLTRFFPFVSGFRIEERSITGMYGRDASECLDFLQEDNLEVPDISNPSEFVHLVRYIDDAVTRALKVKFMNLFSVLTARKNLLDILMVMTRYPWQTQVLCLQVYFSKNIIESLSNSDLLLTLKSYKEKLESLLESTKHGIHRNVMLELFRQKTVVEVLISSSSRRRTFLLQYVPLIFIQGELNEKDTHGEQFQVFVQIGDWKQSYGWKYYPDYNSIVFSEQTMYYFFFFSESCFLNHGVLLYGPAGCGKTEVIQSFAIFIGSHVISANCDDTFTSGDVEGILQCAEEASAFVCLDEVNRLRPHVLECLTSGNPTRVPVFMTMNPEYRGRHPVSERLLELVRQVPMFDIPYNEIIQAMLHVSGCHDSALFQKVLHFFYESFLDKDSLRSLLRSIQFLSRLWDNKALSWEDKISLSLWRVLSLSMNLEQEERFLEALQFCGLITTGRPSSLWESFLQSDIIDTTLSRLASHVCDLIESFSGMFLQSPSLHVSFVFMEYVKSLYMESHRHGGDITLHYVFPYSSSRTLLFGHRSHQSWNEGIIDKLILQSKETGQDTWIVLIGAAESSWAENFNSILDINRKLSLSGSVELRVPDNVRIIFCSESLSFTSPALLSRCVHISKSRFSDLFLCCPSKTCGHQLLWEYETAFSNRLKTDALDLFGEKFPFSEFVSIHHLVALFQDHLLFLDSTKSAISALFIVWTCHVSGEKRAWLRAWFHAQVPFLTETIHSITDSLSFGMAPCASADPISVFCMLTFFKFSSFLVLTGPAIAPKVDFVRTVFPSDRVVEIILDSTSTVSSTVDLILQHGDLRVESQDCMTLHSRFPGEITVLVFELMHLAPSLTGCEVPMAHFFYEAFSQRKIWYRCSDDASLKRLEFINFRFVGLWNSEVVPCEILQIPSIAIEAALSKSVLHPLHSFVSQSSMSFLCQSMDKELHVCEVTSFAFLNRVVDLVKSVEDLDLLLIERCHKKSVSPRLLDTFLKPVLRMQGIPILLVGPSGCGKSSAVQRVAKDLSFSVSHVFPTSKGSFKIVGKESDRRNTIFLLHALQRIDTKSLSYLLRALNSDSLSDFLPSVKSKPYALVMEYDDDHKPMSRDLEEVQKYSHLVSIESVVENASIPRCVLHLAMRKLVQLLWTLWNCTSSRFLHYQNGLENISRVSAQVLQVEFEIRLMETELNEKCVLQSFTLKRLQETKKQQEISLEQQSRLESKLDEKVKQIKKDSEGMTFRLLTLEQAFKKSKDDLTSLPKASLDEIRQMSKPVPLVQEILGAVYLLVHKRSALEWQDVRKFCRSSTFISDIVKASETSDDEILRKVIRHLVFILI